MWYEIREFSQHDWPDFLEHTTSDMNSIRNLSRLIITIYIKLSFVNRSSRDSIIVFRRSGIHFGFERNPPLPVFGFEVALPTTVVEFPRGYPYPSRSRR